MVETLPAKAEPEVAASHRYNILPAQPAAENAGPSEATHARLLMPQSGSAQLFRQSHDLGLERRGSMGEGWPTRRGGSVTMERKTSFGGTSPRPTFSPHFQQQLQQQQQRDFENSQLVRQCTAALARSVLCHQWMGFQFRPSSFCLTLSIINSTHERNGEHTDDCIVTCESGSEHLARQA